ncbi:MAG TPA: hypothetical protein VID04_10105 [Methylomirabilota bacterium]|jgi:hypothetical protein
MRHPSWRQAIGALVVTLALPAAPCGAQVFISSEPRPEFSIGPLFIVGTVSPGLGPVAVRVSWSLTLPPNRSIKDVGQTLYLLWPGEVTASSEPGTVDPAFRRYVEERGFTTVSEGRLALESRDRTKLGTLAENTRLNQTASFVTFYKNGTNPAQSGMGTFIEIPVSPLLVDPISLMSLPLTFRDMITPKPATWLEELFLGRRYVLNMSAGGAGSLALYSLYLDQRHHVVHLARDFSVLVAIFLDADHLRIEEIAPGSATRRPSRVRAGAETISLPIVASEGNVPQVLKVQFSYFSGPLAWRPILVSIAILLASNLMGAYLFAGQIGRFFKRRFHVEPPRGARRRAGVPEAVVLARVAPGATSYDEVVMLCGRPSEEIDRHHSPSVKTLVYRGERRVPHRRWGVGRLVVVKHWDEEHEEVRIDLENDRVTSVHTRVRRIGGAQ